MIEVITKDGHEPLRVTAYTSTPIVYNDPLHFDALAALVSFRHEQAILRRRIDVDHEEFPEDIEIPMSIWATKAPEKCDKRLLLPDGRIWGYCSSVWKLNDPVHTWHEVRRPVAFNEHRRYGEMANVDGSSGPRKAIDKKFPAVAATSISWDIVGDKDEITEILRDINYLGKFADRGMGRVYKWTVESIGKWEPVTNGKVNRELPATVEAQGRRRLAGIRPPYHHTSRRIQCVTPV